jgi:hypothetical protein
MIIQITKENFDWLFYLKQNIDLIENGVISKDSAWNHWINNGIYENREIKIINFLNTSIINLNDISNENNIKIIENNIEIIENNIDYIENKDIKNNNDIIETNNDIINNDIINNDIINNEINNDIINNEINNNINDNEIISYENFNWKFYLNFHNDLKDNCVISKESAWNHWYNYGNNETRMAQILYLENNSNINKEIFDWIFYLDFHDDLLHMGITTKELAWDHWRKIGITENREIQIFYKINASDINYDIFDHIFYINANSDLIENGINKKDTAWDHWINFGKKENRIFAINIKHKNIQNSLIIVNSKEYDYKNIYKKYNKIFGEDKYKLTLKLIKEDQPKILNDIIFDKITKVKMKNYEKTINSPNLNLNTYYFRLFYLKHKTD